MPAPEAAAPVLRIVGTVALLIAAALAAARASGGGALPAAERALRAVLEMTEDAALVPSARRDPAVALDGIRRYLGADGAMWLRGGRAEGGGPLRLQAFAGAGPGGWRPAATAPLDDDLAGRAQSSGAIEVVPDLGRASPGVRADRHPVLAAAGWMAGAAIAIQAERRPLGVLLVGWRSPRRLAGPERVFLAAASNLIAVAAENAVLYRRTQRLAALEEGERLAREMHDGLAQSLTYLKLKAEVGLAQAETETGRALLPGTLEAIRRGALEGLEDVRRAIMDLRAPLTAPAEEFSVHLAGYVRAWSRNSGVETELELPAEPVALPADAQFQVLRIVSEALANTRKHAAAQHVSVRLERDRDGLRLAIRDDGRGFDPEHVDGEGHFGLPILRERGALLGGSVDVVSVPGAGTEVRLRIPLAAPEGDPAPALPRP